MKIILTFPCKGDQGNKLQQRFASFQSLASCAPEGLEIIPLPAGLPGFIPTFPDLDRLWRQRDRNLLSHYDSIIDACADADVLFSIGAGIHPGLLDYLSTFNCYYFCDDPEDSPWQSANVATSFDAAFYGNIASVFQYESWGCLRHAWLPILLLPRDIPLEFDREIAQCADRKNGVVFVGGLDDYSSYRRQRLEKFSNAFPDGLFRGRGWPKGGLSDSELKKFYFESRIGFNIHRTTGPINRRMFQLPAHGVMQICDNKTGLGQIFDLGKEVIGFDTIDEAIELTTYYLENDTERATIAKAGYVRFWKDYHAEAIWTRLRDQLLEWGVKPGERKRGAKQKLPSRNISYFFGVAGEKIQIETSRVIRSAKAAKREYLRKDPWWNIYDRVFNSEAVYLPDYGDLLSEFSKSGFTTKTMDEQTPAHIVRARQGSIRWAMTQLVGKAVRIGVNDPHPDTLVEYLSVYSKRRIEVLAQEEQKSSSLLDLVLCVPASKQSHELVATIRELAKVAPRAAYGFPLGEASVTRAGEIYWLLKSFYENVAVFHMPNPVVPWLEPIKDWNASTSFVAVAERASP
jgi:hypothetical protein